MPNVLNEYAGDGVTQTFNFSMTDGYLSRDYVVFQTRPNDSILGYEDYDRSKITWLTDFSVRTAEPIPVGTTFVITRATPASALVDFQNTSRITERNLDTATRQSLHRTVETADYVARGVVGITELAEVAVDAAEDSAHAAELAASLVLSAEQAAVSAANSAGAAEDLAEAATNTADTALQLINAAVKGNVDSFNGRDGTVLPEAGDYTPPQVGFVLEGVLNGHPEWSAVPAWGSNNYGQNAAAQVLTNRTELLNQRTELLNQRTELLNQRTDKSVLSYPDYAAASAAAATLPVGQHVVIELDETHSHRRARYKVAGGALVFHDYFPDAIRLQTYAALRSYTGVAEVVHITSSGISGRFDYDPTDTTSADNDATLIVGADGRRWKREAYGEILATWFGADPSGIADSTIPLQNAITVASATGVGLTINGVFKVSSTLNFPTNGAGAILRGAGRTSAIKYTGTGALLNTHSTHSMGVQNLTLVGPGSSVACTAIQCDTEDYTRGVYYCSFSGLTIEGFQTGMQIAGLCEATFKDIKIGLAKSGLFTGTDIEACPVIGIDIKTTVLACQFEGLTIFAKQRCVQQTTQQQLDEGLYFWGCTFDLSFNTGKNINQSCVYFESGQDIVFTGCWFTNTQKYGSTSAPYTDNLVRFAYNKGSINAPIAALKFIGCTMAGNGVSLQFGNEPLLTREVSLVGNILRMWADLGQFVMGGSLNGLTFNDNNVQMYGSSALGGTAYDLPVAPFNITNVRNFTINGNTIAGVLPINTAPSYIILGDTSDGVVSGNKFPAQNSLTNGTDVSVQGTKVNVVVIGGQQSDASRLVASLPDGTYTAGSTIASINTEQTKPRLALVEVYVDLAQITNPGGGDMFFSIDGLNGPDKYQRLTSTGSQPLRFSCVAHVSGILRFKVESSLQAVISSSSSFYRQFKVTFI